MAEPTLHRWQSSRADEAAQSSGKANSRPATWWEGSHGDRAIWTAMGDLSRGGVRRKLAYHMLRSRSSVLFAFAVSGLLLACGGRALRDDIAGTDPMGKGGSGGPAATCQPGGESDCVCRTGAMGTALCQANGQRGLCQCPDLADKGGLPDGCEVGVECGSCGTCLSQCVCNTSNFEQCLAICSECSGGHVEDLNTCSSSDFGLPWAHACFGSEEQACRCACDGGNGGGCIIDGGSVPPSVVCVI